MSHVILQPAGNGFATKHYVDTIENPVFVEKISQFISQEVFEKLRILFPEGKVAVWGVTPGKKNVNKNKWSLVKSGDVVLFARNSQIFASATVAFKVHNKDLALYLWQTNPQGETWEYIYFLDEVKDQQIPYTKFNQIADYASNFVIQGFNVLDELKSAKILTLLDLESQIFYPETTKEEYFQSISSPSPDSPLDKISYSKSRTEQSFLRSVLFKSKISPCGICGKEYPINFLVAAHIKKRSSCSDEEKRDYSNIVIPMCKFGCDELYEKGYIVVENGIIKESKSKFVTEPIKAYLIKIVGKNCELWNSGNKKYFDWHCKLNL